MCGRLSGRDRHMSVKSNGRREQDGPSADTDVDVEMDLESNGRTLTSKSMTLDISEDRLSEKKEDEIETSPVDPVSDAGDYPDGGLVAWCVVLGVSRFTISSSFQTC